MKTHAPFPDRPDLRSGGKFQQKSCRFCGRFFKPDSRVGDRQIACGRDVCARRRKQASQRAWVAGNPGYFNGRSAETRAWRLKNPGYQKAWRRRRREIQDEMSNKSSIITVYLAITEERLKVEIQDEIRRQKALGRGFLACGRPREIQDEIAVPIALGHTPP